MKKYGKIAGIIKWITVVLLVEVLVFQFTPFWKYDGKAVSIASYLWFPDDNKDFEEAYKAELSDKVIEEFKKANQKEEEEEEYYIPEEAPVEEESTEETTDATTEETTDATTEESTDATTEESTEVTPEESTDATTEETTDATTEEDAQAPVEEAEVEEEEEEEEEELVLDKATKEKLALIKQIKVDDIVTLAICQLVASIVGILLYIRKKERGAMAALAPIIAGGAGVLACLTKPVYQVGVACTQLLGISGGVLILGVVMFAVSIIKIVTEEE